MKNLLLFMHEAAAARSETRHRSMRLRTSVTGTRRNTYAIDKWCKHLHACSCAKGRNFKHL